MRQKFYSIIAIVATHLLAGCTTTYTANGKLTTTNNLPLSIATNSSVAPLQPGATTVMFGTKPLLSNTLTINNADHVITIDLSASDYTAQSFEKKSSASGWLYDIKGIWQESRGDTHVQEEQEACTAYAFCTKSVMILDCPQGRFSEGSEGYYKQLNNHDCTQTSEIQSGYFSNCPGKRTVKNTYRDIRYVLTLDFIYPDIQHSRHAQFRGETDSMRALEHSEILSDCKVP